MSLGTTVSASPSIGKTSSSSHGVSPLSAASWCQPVSTTDTLMPRPNASLRVRARDRSLAQRQLRLGGRAHLAAARHGDVDDVVGVDDLSTDLLVDLVEQPHDVVGLSVGSSWQVVAHQLSEERLGPALVDVRVLPLPEERVEPLRGVVGPAHEPVRVREVGGLLVALVERDAADTTQVAEGVLDEPKLERGDLRPEPVVVLWIPGPVRIAHG